MVQCTDGACAGDLLLGFVHYRFVVEEDVPVVYVYELQLESTAQKKGLGKFLMQLIELVARKVNYLLKNGSSLFYYCYYDVKTYDIMAVLLVCESFFLSDCNYGDILASMIIEFIQNAYVYAEPNGSRDADSSKI